ncbi:hypothetical protein C0995_007757 [Termitomyces sp. Mi166|nr:hypothetical protein C0995_007757 [Termitomyces sp. Mi166\
MAYIILDDSTSHLTSSSSHPATLDTNEELCWFGGTASSFPHGDSVTLSFSGVSAAFYGYGSSDFSEDTNIAVSVDGDTSVVPLMQDTNPWFSTKTLSDARHNITFPHGFDYLLDFITVTVSKDTPLVGERLIVDDSDPSLVYSGSWMRNNSRLDEINEVYLIPFNGSFIQTQDIQASVTFNFIGGMFTLDQIVYSPSFSSLAALGNSTHGVPSATSPLTGPSESGASNSGHAPLSVLIGAPVGAIIGALLLAYLIFMLRGRLFPGFTSTAKKRRPALLIDPEEPLPRDPAPPSSATKSADPFSASASYHDKFDSATSTSGRFDSPPSSPQEPLSPTSSASRGRSRIQLIVQGGNPDMVQIPPPEKPLSKSSGGQQHSPSSGAGPSRLIEVESQAMVDADMDRGRHTGELVIVGNSMVTTPMDSLPPSYEQVQKSGGKS